MYFLSVFSKSVFSKSVFSECVFSESVFSESVFLASQDALEVMRVTESLTYLLTKRSR